MLQECSSSQNSPTAVGSPQSSPKYTPRTRAQGRGSVTAEARGTLSCRRYEAYRQAGAVSGYSKQLAAGCLGGAKRGRGAAPAGHARSMARFEGLVKQ